MGSQSGFSPVGCLVLFFILLLLRTLGPEFVTVLALISIGLMVLWNVGAILFRLAQFFASRFGNAEMAPALMFGTIAGALLILVLGAVVYDSVVSSFGALCRWFVKLLSWRDGMIAVASVGVLIVGGILWSVFAIAKAASKNRADEEEEEKETPETSLLWNRIGGEITIVGLNGEATELRLPNAIGGTPVTTIRNGSWNHGAPTGAFAECDTLVKVVLPSELKLLGSYAFKGCDYLSTVLLPKGLKEIGHGAFYGCGNLERVRLPEELERLHGGAFCNCASLTRVRVPSGVKVVEQLAFSGCVSLRRVELAEGVEALGESSLGSCASLTSVTTPSTLRRIDNFAFKGCVALSDLELSEGLEKIGDGAFYGCSELLEVTLPSTLVTIGELAFPSETRFNVYANTEGERWAKRMGRPFTLITTAPLRVAPKVGDVASAPSPVLSEQTSAFVRARRVARRRASQNCLTYYPDAHCAIRGVFHVPESVGGAPVVRVGEAAFKNNLGLVGVVVPYGVGRIENHAFCGCAALQQAFIPESVTVIGARAFDECTRLRTIVVPRSVVRIDKRAFGPSTCLCVYAGSYAASWGKEHGQPTRFVAEQKRRGRLRIGKSASNS